MVAPGLGVGVVRELAGEVKVVPTRVLAFSLGKQNKQTKPKQNKNKNKTESLAKLTKQNEHGKLK